MRHDLTDADVRCFAQAGCNAAEVAAYAGTSELVAQARLNRAIRELGQAEPRGTLHLRGSAWPEDARHIAPARGAQP